MKSMIASFPTARARRLRRTDALRALARENHLSVNDLIWPVFICDGDNIEDPVPSMPGVMRRSVDKVVEAAREAADLGIPAICMFPYTGIEERTADCAEAHGNPQNHVQPRHPRHQGGGA